MKKIVSLLFAPPATSFDAGFLFTIEVFKGAAGRQLTDIECHDLMCKIGEIVVVGGVG